MLDINMSDVMNVLGLIRPYLIAFGVILAAAVILILAVRKVKEPRRYLIRSQARVAVVISLMVVVSLICTGPLSTLLSLVSGHAGSGGSAWHGNCRRGHCASEK